MPRLLHSGSIQEPSDPGKSASDQRMLSTRAVSLIPHTAVFDHLESAKTVLQPICDAALEMRSASLAYLKKVLDLGNETSARMVIDIDILSAMGAVEKSVLGGRLLAERGLKFRLNVEETHKEATASSSKLNYVVTTESKSMLEMKLSNGLPRYMIYIEAKPCLALNRDAHHPTVRKFMHQLRCGLDEVSDHLSFTKSQR